MFLKTVVRFDPQTHNVDIRSDIHDPKVLAKVLLQAVAMIVDQPTPKQQRLIVPPPGIVVQ